MQLRECLQSRVNTRRAKDDSFRTLPGEHRRDWRWFSLAGLFLLMLAGGWISQSFGAATPVSVLASQATRQSKLTPKEKEYQVKAAFVYNFMKFTEWPEEKMNPLSGKKERKSSAKDPMVIGIVGKNPFQKAFDPLLSKTIKDRPLKVVFIPGMAEVLKRPSDRAKAVQRYFKGRKKTMQTCHVLFFCQSEKECLEEYLQVIREESILTVSDTNHFVDQKGVIGFVKEKNKVRFEINLVQAQAKHLKIRSQLLKLATRVVQDEK